MEECPSSNKRIIIPKGTLDPDQNNIIEIPNEYEDSLVLIARLQKRFNKPPRYYPPKTNPDNKFERRIGDTVVGLGMPPLSPIKEERHNYKYSLSQYGPPKHNSYEPSYFGTDTTHGEHTMSGKFDYCPSSTPIRHQCNVATDFPSPKLSPIRIGRDIFAPEASVYRSAYTPSRTPPPRPVNAVYDDCSCISTDVSGRGSLSPKPLSPRRLSPPQRTPEQRSSPISDRSCSFGDISDMVSFNTSRPKSPRKPQLRRASPPQRPQSPMRVPLPQRSPQLPCTQSPGYDENCSFDDISDMISFRPSRPNSPQKPQLRRASPTQRPPTSIRVPSPQRSPQLLRTQSPGCDESCSFGDLSDMISFNASRPKSSRKPQLRRASPPQRPQSPMRVPSPQRSPQLPCTQSPGCDESCSFGDLSDMISFNASRPNSPQNPQLRRASPTQRPPTSIRVPSPQRSPQILRTQSPGCDESCSLGDLSDLVSFEASRGARPSQNYTPDSIRGMSQIGRNALATPSTPIPEDLVNSIMNDSMAELNSLEQDERKNIQERMRSFQEARRELVMSILSLPEADVTLD